MIHAAGYQSLAELIRDALIQFKSETAFVEATRSTETDRLTYLEVKRRSMALAARLEEAHVGADDRVAILMSNQWRWPISAYAAMYRGAVLVPLDYKLSEPELAALIAHAKPKALIVEGHIWKGLAKLGVDVPLVIESESIEGSSEREATYVPRTRSDLATIVYSSGTGGRPKGCMLTHDNYLEQLASLTELFPMEVGDRYFSILPTNHAIDFMCGFVGPLTGGAAIVHQRVLRPELISETMKRYRITHMAIVPLILEAFERAIREKLEAQPMFVQRFVHGIASVNETLTRRSPNHALSRTLLKPIHDAFGGELRLLFCGGAFTDRKRAELFYRLGLPVVIGYGLTEACTVATVNDLKPFRGDSVGRPVRGVEIEIARPDAHGVGEVLIKGRTVMRGYLDDAEQTAETIKDGWLHTGDLGYLDAAGHLHLVGRSKNMIVTSGGKNVYPEDIEMVFDGLPCAELAVFASGYVQSNVSLQEEKLIAVVRTKNGEAPRSVITALEDRNRRLPDFKRVRGVVIWDREFPRTASMKIKRNLLAEQLRSGAPDITELD